MSIRTVVHRFLQNGRALLHSVRNTECFYSNYHPRNYHDKIHVVQVGKSQGFLPQGNSNVSNTGRHLGYLGAQARRIFVDNILKRVTNSLAADLRRRAAKRLVFGDSAPFFALVGVSLASGTGILTKDDELEGVCWEIREAVSKLQWNTPQNDTNYETIKDNANVLSLEDFVIGPAIAKGCSAIVYATRFNNSAFDKGNGQLNIDNKAMDVTAFPLALKMMFNYNTESNALSILRAMHRETVPARKHLNNEELADWETKMAERKAKLPPHPNIVAMYYAFADKVPALPDSLKMYPDALPARINPQGLGRNMSLFLLMKRYDITLQQYLSDRNPSTRESILLLAQLLEGVAHMNAHGIAHRDLKSDNILLDLSEETDNCPSLVITDFGCCLADIRHGLYLPYNSHDTDRGGNIVLMAPEVITAEPGPFTSVNYTKADLWTVGTIAYEIFGMKNPFHDVVDKEKTSLKNFNYKESDLPSLPNDVPTIVSALIKNILSRNLYKRLDTETAATVIQLHLWAPSAWFRSEGQLPSSNEVMQWLLCLTTKVLCEGRNSPLLFPKMLHDENFEDVKMNFYHRSISTRSCGRRTMPEYQLIASFLGRVTLSNIRSALKWIQNNV